MKFGQTRTKSILLNSYEPADRHSRFIKQPDRQFLPFVEIQEGKRRYESSRRDPENPHLLLRQLHSRAWFKILVALVLTHGDAFRSNAIERATPARVKCSMHGPLKGKIILRTFVCLLLGLVVLCLWQARELRRSRAQLVQLQVELDVQRADSLDYQTQLKSLEKQRNDLRENVTGLRGTLDQAAGSNKPPTASESPQAIESEPELAADRARIRQITGAIMAKQLYGPLLKDLGLDGADADKFVGALAASLYTAEGRERRGEEKTAAVDQAARDFLTPEQFAGYQTYKETMVERLKLDQLESHLKRMNLDLSDQQHLQLIEAINEQHRQGLPPEPDVRGWIQQIDAHFQRQEQANIDLRQRAQAILTPDQLAIYSRYQDQLNRLQREGIANTLASYFDKSWGAWIRPDPEVK
jgi:hypothetical protein